MSSGHCPAFFIRAAWLDACPVCGAC